MIEVKNKGKVYEMKSKLEEITTKEFSLISDIFEKENYTTIDKYMESFKVLGIPNDVINAIGSKAFIAIIKSLKWFEKLDGLPRVIEFNGEVIELYEKGEEYDLPASRMSKIEAALKAGKGVEYVMALILGVEPKDENLKLIGELPASLTAPYFAWMQVSIVENVNDMLSNEVGGI